jgi:hypothetical protein
MTANKNLILAGVAGGGSGVSLAWVAPLGAAAPTSATTTLAAGSNEVQTVTITGVPTGGTFTLSFGGQTTSPIAYNAIASAVQSALQALSTIGTGNATVAGSAGGPYTVTFVGALSGIDVALLTASGASLTGGTTPTVTVVATTPGVTGWLDAGWISDKGLVAKLQESTKEITAFGTTSPVRTLITQAKQNFDVTFLESNPVSLAVYNRKPLGSLTPDGTGAMSFSTGKPDLPHFAACFDIVDGANHIRAYCADVAVTGRVDLAAQAGQEIAYGVTLTAYPGSDGNAIQWFYLLDALKS